MHTTGTLNTFVGEGAGNTATTATGRNAAFGESALTSLTIGSENAAFGKDALRANTVGSWNAGFGERALYTNTAGYANSAFGWKVLYTMNLATRNSAFGYQTLLANTTGFSNSAFGTSALVSTTTGARNVALGDSAGGAQTTGDDNIYIDNLGVSGESGKIKIGNSAHTETFIEGIWMNTVGGTSADVIVNASGDLGTIPSSLRFKEAVRDMGEASNLLMRLRPVTFRYREPLAEGRNTREYGLIAEEVAAQAPELVIRGDDGRPYSVRYHLLAPMLLNEMQKQQRTIETLQARLDQLEQAPGTHSQESGR